MEVLLGEQKGGRAAGSVRGGSGGGLPPDQLVEYVGTELVELDGGETQQLVPRLVGLLLVIGVTGVEEGAQGNVVLIEDGLVEVAADTVAAAVAASIHVGAIAGAGDGGGRRWTTGAPGARSVGEAVDAHVAVGATRIRGRGEVGSTVGKGAVVGSLVL